MTAFPLADSALGDRLSARLEIVEERLRDAVTNVDPLADDASRHLVNAGGKRLRPLLTLLAAELGDGSRLEVIDAAVVVELTHLATLYHDDVMDSAPFRRGAPTAHEVWGNSVAVLTGDLIFARASILVSELGSRALISLSAAWSHCRLRRRRAGASLRLRLVDVYAHARHGPPDRLPVFLRRQRVQTFGCGQLHVDAQPVGIAARTRQQLGACFGYGLEVYVAAEVMLFAQHTRHFDHLFHGVVGASDDAGAEKQTFDAIAAIEVERELHDFVYAEARPRHIAADPVDAIQAIVEAVIGEQNLQQRDAAAVGRIAVADAGAFSRAQASAAYGISSGGSAGGA